MKKFIINDREDVIVECCDKAYHERIIHCPAYSRYKSTEGICNIALRRIVGINQMPDFCPLEEVRREYK